MHYYGTFFLYKLIIKETMHSPQYYYYYCYYYQYHYYRLIFDRRSFGQNKNYFTSR